MREIGECIEMIAHYEGFRAHVYKCSGGYDTVGYGHRVLRGEDFSGGVTPDEARIILKRDVAIFEREVLTLLQNKACKWNPTGHEFGALVSFAFNVGFTNFRTSTLVKKLLVGDVYGAAGEFCRWNLSGTGSKRRGYRGLVRRRLSETVMFMFGKLEFF